MARGMTDAAEAATVYLLLWFSILYRFIGGGKQLAMLMCNAPGSSHEMPRDIPEMEQGFSENLFLQPDEVLDPEDLEARATTSCSMKGSRATTISGPLPLRLSQA